MRVGWKLAEDQGRGFREAGLRPGGGEGRFATATDLVSHALCRVGQVREECGVWGLQIVPALERRAFHSLADLTALLDRHSAFGDEPIEGIYLRVDEGEWLAKRGKIVRASFVQAMEDDGHWMARGLVRNQLLR
jgi:hypothetical protein